MEYRFEGGRLVLPDRAGHAREALFFVSSRSGMMVKRPAVGAEGFVLNHYDRNALDHYLRTVGATHAEKSTVASGQLNAVASRAAAPTIDAVAGTAGNQRFTFIGTAAFTGEGQVRVRRTLLRGGDGQEIPSAARFHVTPDHRLFVVCYASGSEGGGRNIAENRILEILPDGFGFLRADFLQLAGFMKRGRHGFGPGGSQRSCQ